MVVLKCHSNIFPKNIPSIEIPFHSDLSHPLTCCGHFSVVLGVVPEKEMFNIHLNGENFFIPSFYFFLKISRVLPNRYSFNPDKDIIVSCGVTFLAYCYKPNK